MKVNGKNSFDRLGDDMTELIVSYLWFEDKVRLECMSKQWRRLVFKKRVCPWNWWKRRAEQIKKSLEIYIFQQNIDKTNVWITAEEVSEYNENQF